MTRSVPAATSAGPLRGALSAEAVNAAKSAASGTRTDFRTLLASAHAESRHDPAARNPRSSATGAYQFTERTWLDLVRRHGASLGLGDLAAQIGTDRGAPVVGNPDLRGRILSLRSDTRLAASLAARYSDENRVQLGRFLGRKVSDPEVRMAYLLGAHGAAKVIKAAQHEPDLGVDKLLPAAVKNNRSLFVKPSGEVRSAAEAVASLTQRFEAEARQFRQVAAVPRGVAGVFVAES